MRRYASHYVHHPVDGWLRQQVVELSAGVFVRLFPLTEEVEDVEWLPGVIFLEAQAEGGWQAFWCYPFDFKTMQPVSGTRRRRLR